MSTEYYNVTEKQNYWASWFVVHEKGEWKVQLIIEYSIRNYSYSLDEIDTFEVI
jgi:hypothetical protein